MPYGGIGSTPSASGLPGRLNEHMAGNTNFDDFDLA
jgi:hypothetical protein